MSRETFEREELRNPANIAAPPTKVTSRPSRGRICLFSRWRKKGGGRPPLQLTRRLAIVTSQMWPFPGNTSQMSVNPLRGPRERTRTSLTPTTWRATRLKIGIQRYVISCRPRRMSPTKSKPCLHSRLASFGMLQRWQDGEIRELLTGQGQHETTDCRQTRLHVPLHRRLPHIVMWFMIYHRAASGFTCMLAFPRPHGGIARHGAR